MGGDIQGGDKRSAEIGENKAPDSFKAAIVEITKSLQQQSVVYDEKPLSCLMQVEAMHYLDYLFSLSPLLCGR